MVTLECKVSIIDKNTNKLKYLITSVNSIEIERSRNKFTATAKLVIPNKLRDKGVSMRASIFVGDIIDIELGYSGYPMINEFHGYISKFNPDSPMEIECEDEMYLLKRQNPVQKTLKNTNLRDLVKLLYKGKQVVEDANIGTFILKGNYSITDVFDILRKNFLTFTYFKNRVLHCEIFLKPENEKTIVFDNNKNVPQDGERLKYQDDVDGAIIAYGKSKQKNGTVIHRYAYYKDNVDAANSEIILTSTKPNGQINTFSVPNYTQKQLDDHLKRWLPNLWFKGVTGNITTFGFPSFDHGDIARIVNSRLPERNGDYRIVAVKKEFSVNNGYKQTAELGRKIQ